MTRAPKNVAILSSRRKMLSPNCIECELIIYMWLRVLLAGEPCYKKALSEGSFQKNANWAWDSNKGAAYTQAKIVIIQAWIKMFYQCWFFQVFSQCKTRFDMLTIKNTFLALQLRPTNLDFFHCHKDANLAHESISKEAMKWRD